MHLLAVAHDIYNPLMLLHLFCLDCMQISITGIGLRSGTAMVHPLRGILRQLIL